MSKSASSPRTGRPPKFQPKQIIAALEASAGILAAAARMLRCDTATVRRYVAAHREVAAALHEVVEDRLDLAEIGLVKFLGDDKNPTLKLRAIEFYLSTKGRHRGYAKTTELVGKNGGAIQTQNTATLDLSGLSADELAMLEKAALLSVNRPAIKH